MIRCLKWSPLPLAQELIYHPYWLHVAFHHSSFMRLCTYSGHLICPPMIETLLNPSQPSTHANVGGEPTIAWSDHKPSLLASRAFRHPSWASVPSEEACIHFSVLVYPPARDDWLLPFDEYMWIPDNCLYLIWLVLCITYMIWIVAYKCKEFCI